ncbi:MAG: hypothetical protein IJP22_04585 [Clostridia bacterium]|nr:hypothetical protein [Clostridia bacterium]
MRNTTRITFGGIMAALSVVFMLLSYFPYFTYAAPGIASLAIMVCVIESDKKLAFSVYIAASIIVFLLAESESKFVFVLFFGYYPIIKAVLDGKLKGIVLWITKLVIFNISVFAIYFVTSRTLGITFEEFNDLGKYGIIIILLVLNIAFVLYDIAISRMAVFYICRLQKSVRKMLKF